MSDMRLPRPPVRDQFRKRLRADLMSEAVALAEERRMRRSFAERFLTVIAVRLRPIAVAAAVVVVLLAGTGAAAAGSLPGDPTFALKRAAEQVELAFAADDDAKVRVLAAQAERRLDELGKSASHPANAPTASAEYEAAVQRLAAAVVALRTAPPGAKREAAEQVVEAARERHIQVLEQLKERVPEAAKRGIERAIEQHDRLAPPGKPGERSPKKDDQRPGSGPGGPEASASPRESERPRASETPRGGRPSVTPIPHR